MFFVKTFIRKRGSHSQNAKKIAISKVQLFRLPDAMFREYYIQNAKIEHNFEHARLTKKDNPVNFNLLTSVKLRKVLENLRFNFGKN